METKDIISNILAGNSLEGRKQLDTLLKSKIASALETEKKRIAKLIFNKTAEEKG
ncbi:uncharacterized protein METZ01_LOCUS266030 [marine metagenome]|jgi:hypothetical protein|uniref:Uncharacterized protein n=1 Tax=marine metagenome TaxID=408172 RepID=A0A382JN55_9ZZZZ|tara:strand:+ start:170 stop:334 length:165 start_codon:yes stop_codon:yes gene_type:complete